MMTAPGAPLTGLAVPLSTPPRPSPIHHTPNDQPMEATRAAFRVGRQAIPRPNATCQKANTASVATAWLPMVRPDQWIGAASTCGFPADMVAIIWSPNARVKKTDCIWRRPSKSHSVASTNCRVRRASGFVQARGRTGLAVVVGTPDVADVAASTEASLMTDPNAAPPHSLSPVLPTVNYTT